MTDHYERAEAMERGQDEQDDLRAEVERLKKDLAWMTNDRNEAATAALGLSADRDRLRGLIKEARNAAGETAGACPWCDGLPTAHADCPAFHPDGEVK